MLPSQKAKQKQFANRAALADGGKGEGDGVKEERKVKVMSRGGGNGGGGKDYVGWGRGGLVRASP